MKIPNDILADILFIFGVLSIVGVLVYHTFYPRAFTECELEANRLGTTFTYNNFYGCEIHDGGNNQ